VWNWWVSQELNPPYETELLYRTKQALAAGGVERGEDCAYLFNRQQWNEGLT
jgi:hypothetical protein